MRSLKTIRRSLAYLLLAVIFANILIPLTSSAEKKEQKTVRVGWFDSSFCYFDSFGRRCGVDYEYHQKISAYTGWTYEYVEDSWPNLLQMLIEGKIDLLSDVSYKPERADKIFFSELPMGTEAYYIYISAENREIKADDLSTFKGKRIGVNKGSVQAGFLKDWAEKKNVSIETVPLTCTENESMEMIMNGEIDGLATVFTFDYEREVLPVSRIGGSDYYYAVSRDRPDLLEELNVAMAEIQDEDHLFNERISKDRIYNSKAKCLLTPQQEDWLREHGEIRIGYRDNYYPFCSTDSETGELTGALKDFLAHATNNLKSPNIRFKTVPYASTEDALTALKAGEVDCVFPVYLSTYDADQRGLQLSYPAMGTEMNAVIRLSEHQDLSDDTTMTFAVNANMINVETFIKNYYPMSTIKSFNSLQECYDAVADGKADGVLVSNYRILSEEENLKKKKLYSVPTGGSLPLSFAVDRSSRELYSIMNKTVLASQSTEINAALASYIYADKEQTTFLQYLKDNLIVVLAVLTVLFAVILFLLSQKLRAERIANKQRHLLEEASQVADLQQTVSSLLNNMPGVYLTKDAKTGEYLACNQAFADYLHKKDPSEVVGLTAADLFDEERAKRFAEDDKMVLSMDEPLIYYDKMEDSFGSVSNVKVTKQKYTDTNGRLCVLGIFQDVSDSFRISRDKASTKESYEKARNTSIIFTHIAQALASGFMVLYYVDLVTEEFIEYRSDEKDGTLSEVRRAWHFFEEGQDAAEVNVYQEDRDEVIRAMDRRTLEAALDQNNVFMISYRMITENGPMYVSMKVTRMQDDKRYIILSLTDVDEQMKHRHAAQRVQEEQTAYSRISALAGDFLCIYIVVPETGRYREYSSEAGFDSFEMPSEGENFFSDLRQNSIKAV